MIAKRRIYFTDYFGHSDNRSFGETGQRATITTLKHRTLDRANQSGVDKKTSEEWTRKHKHDLFVGRQWWTKKAEPDGLGA